MSDPSLKRALAETTFTSSSSSSTPSYDVDSTFSLEPPMKKRKHLAWVAPAEAAVALFQELRRGVSLTTAMDAAECHGEYNTEDIRKAPNYFPLQTYGKRTGKAQCFLGRRCPATPASTQSPPAVPKWLKTGAIDNPSADVIVVGYEAFNKKVQARLYWDTHLLDYSYFVVYDNREGNENNQSPPITNEELASLGDSTLPDEDSRAMDGAEETLSSAMSSAALDDFSDPLSIRDLTVRENHYAIRAHELPLLNERMDILEQILSDVQRELECMRLGQDAQSEIINQLATKFMSKDGTILTLEDHAALICEKLGVNPTTHLTSALNIVAQAKPIMAMSWTSKNWSHFEKQFQEFKLKKRFRHTQNVVLRDYQREMVNRVLSSPEPRFMLIMPTGSGKTAVASEIILQTLMFPKDTASNPPNLKCAFFVVRDVALLQQQQHALRHAAASRNPPQKWRICYSGGGQSVSNDSKLQEPVKLELLMQEHDVIVWTAGRLKEQIAKTPSFDWSNVPVVVLDEVHNATGASDFVKLLEMTNTWSSRPGVLIGLTATPTFKGRSSADFEKELKLFAHTHSLVPLVLSRDDPRLEKLVARPSMHEIKIDYPTDPCYRMVVELVGTLARQYYRNVNDMMQLLQWDRPKIYACDSLAVDSSETFAWSKQVADRAAKESLEELRVHASALRDLIESMRIFNGVGIKFAMDVLSYIEGVSRRRAGPKHVVTLRLKQLRKEVGNHVYQVSSAKLPESDKLQKLRGILSRAHEIDGNFKCIVRVETRQTANILKQHLDHPSWLKADVFLGRSSSNEIYSMKQKLDQFKAGALNVLVCTSVIQEGVDVPSCNLVVCFDVSTIPNGSGMLQLMGRGRKSGAEFYTFYLGEVERIAYEKAVSQAESQLAVLSRLGISAEETVA